jgi:hypothetical protein
LWFRELKRGHINGWEVRDVMRILADHGLNDTDFWGPASNFGIPIAAVMDTQKDPEMYV